MKSRMAGVLNLCFSIFKGIFAASALFQRAAAMGDTITVAVHIGRIREKLEDDPANPQTPADRLGRRIPAERRHGFILSGNMKSVFCNGTVRCGRRFLFGIAQSFYVSACKSQRLQRAGGPDPSQRRIGNRSFWFSCVYMFSRVMRTQATSTKSSVCSPFATRTACWTAI